MKHLSPGLSLLALTFLTLATSLPAQSEATEELGRRMDTTVQQVTHGAFWGVVLVARGEEVVLSKGYGFADYAARPNGPDTLFEIAAVSRSFTAAAIFKLEMEGKLDVDASIASVLDGVPEDKAEITIQQLLTHVAGISPIIGTPWVSPYTRDQFLRYLFSRPLASDPGANFDDWNAGYALLAAVVEVASGQSFESYLEERLFEPAGMKDTGFVGSDALDAGRAAVRLSDQADEPATSLSWHWGYQGMGGVVTTASDLLRFDRALRSHRVLSPEATRRMLTPIPEESASGWHSTTTAEGRTKSQRSGATPGFRVNYVRYTDEDVVIVVLTNERSDPVKLTREIEKLLFAPKPINVVIDLRSHEQGTKSELALSEASHWSVLQEPDGVRLQLHHGGDDAVIVSVHVPNTRAARMVQELAAYLDLERSDTGNQEVEGWVLHGRYGEAGNPVELSAEVTLEVRPQYNRDQHGGRDRIHVSIHDEPHHFIPIGTQLSNPAAQRLLEAIERALPR